MGHLQLRKLSHYNERKDQLIARYARCERAIEDPRIKQGFYKLRKYDEINYEAHFLRTKIDITKESLSPLDKQILTLFDEYERRIEKQLPIIAILGETPDLAIVRRELVENAREAAKVAVLIKLLADRKGSSLSQAVLHAVKQRSSPLASTSLSSASSSNLSTSNSLLTSLMDSTPGTIKKKATRGRPRNPLKVKPPKPSEETSNPFPQLPQATTASTDPLFVTSIASSDQSHLFVTVRIKNPHKLVKALGCEVTSSERSLPLCGPEPSSDVLKSASHSSSLLVALVTQNRANNMNNGIVTNVPVLEESFSQQSKLPALKFSPLPVLKDQHILAPVSENQHHRKNDVTLVPKVVTGLSIPLGSFSVSGVLSLSNSVPLVAHARGPYGVTEPVFGPGLPQFQNLGLNRVSGTNPLHQSNPAFEQSAGNSRPFVQPDAVPVNVQPLSSNNVWSPSKASLPSTISHVSSTYRSTDVTSVVPSNRTPKIVKTLKPTIIGETTAHINIGANGHHPIEPKFLKRKADFEEEGTPSFSRLRISAPLRSFDLLEKWSPVYVKTVFEAADRSNVAENKRNYVQQMYDERFNVAITKRQANYLLLHYGLRFSSPSPLEFNPVMDEIQKQYPEDIEKIRYEVKKRTGFHLSAYDAECAIQMRRLFLKIYRLYTEPEENYSPYYEKYSRIMPRRPYATIVAFSPLEQSDSDDPIATSSSSPVSPFSVSQDKAPDVSAAKTEVVEDKVAQKKPQRQPSVEETPLAHPETNKQLSNIPKKYSTDEFLSDKKLLLQLRKIYSTSTDNLDRIHTIQETLLRDSNVKLETYQIEQALSALGLTTRRKLNGLSNNALKRVPSIFSGNNLVLNGDTTKSHSIWLINGNKKRGLSHLDLRIRSPHTTTQFTQGASESTAFGSAIYLNSENFNKLIPGIGKGLPMPIRASNSTPYGSAIGKPILATSVTIPALRNSTPELGIPDAKPNAESRQSNESDVILVPSSDLSKDSASSKSLVEYVKEAIVSPPANIDASPSRRFYNKPTSSPPILNATSPLATEKGKSSPVVSLDGERENLKKSMTLLMVANEHSVAKKPQMNGSS